ncbi:epoxide hydrolase family protein [Rhizobium sp. 2MFCol3.1]|uniref:epoxide hydrolase family protein n=1 Tax=Rhizobium sp. 2MFCol3.1 TaxID=1246459 RepID=UPI000377E4B1|nr:epoxide hydrolase family protein [Rhizobium sp. 2MFCol3.1]
MTPTSKTLSPGFDPSRRFLLTAAAALPVIAAVEPAVAAPASAAVPAATEAITPFKVKIPAAAISDLRTRLKLARLPEKETVDDWSQGAPLHSVELLLTYWRDKYDMGRVEKRLNVYPQFRTEIDGLGIHFIHVKSKHDGARPLILTHGWPGSVIEFLNVIDPLTNPTAHGGKAEDAFHVVIPSLPGFGFSDKPTKAGWGLPRIAKAWAVLMQRLGYTEYYAQGGDYGAGVTTWMAKQHVPGLKGIHLNLPILFPPPIEGTPTAEEQASIAQLVAYGTHEAGYAKLQTTRPQTIGYALTDSPIGEASWIYEKFGNWTDSDHHPEKVLGYDQMLDDITLYWLTETAASSARLYWESFETTFTPQKLDIPVGVSVFPGELFRPLKIWGDRMYSKLTYWGEATHGGHFAAFEQPQIFTEELRKAFATM